MKKSKNIILLILVACLLIALVGITYFLRNQGDDQAMITSKVRAQAVTYSRDIDLLAQNPVSPTITLTNTLTPTISVLTPTSTPSATLTISPTLISTPSATPTASATATLIPTETLTPTTIQALPRTGWTQNVSIMFVAASVLMFVSFIF